MGMTQEEKDTLKLLREKERQERESKQNKKIKKKNKNRKGRFMKIVIISMLLFLFLFTSLCLYITYKTSVEPSTLIASVFAYCSIEGGLLSLVKCSKVKNNYNNNDDI